MPRAVCNQEYFGTATHNISLAARFNGWREYSRVELRWAFIVRHMRTLKATVGALLSQYNMARVVV